MLEFTTTRHNPLIDPHLAVWSWEIPVYLFLGGLVAGMMILAGAAMLRLARGDDPRRYFSLHAPLLSFVLINLGMGALFLDLTHKLYVWRVYLTFQPGSPMSWGSWLLIIVYGVLLASATIRLPEAWPWIGRKVPILQPRVGCAAGAPEPGSRARLGKHPAWRRSSASIPGSSSTRWSRDRCGTARSSGRCSCSPGCRPAPRCFTSRASRAARSPRRKTCSAARWRR